MVAPELVEKAQRWNEDDSVAMPIPVDLGNQSRTALMEPTRAFLRAYLKDDDAADKALGGIWRTHKDIATNIWLVVGIAVELLANGCPVDVLVTEIQYSLLGGDDEDDTEDDDEFEGEDLT